MFTNKHVIVALLVTPILAILAYFGVDAVVSEKPHKAEAGGTYELIAKSNCRYASGMCTFKNGDMELSITMTESANDLLVTVTSAVPLKGVTLSIAPEGSNTTPLDFAPLNDENLLWQGRFNFAYTGKEILRLAASAGGAIYFGETVAPFAEYQSSFGEDFRRESE